MAKKATKRPQTVREIQAKKKKQQDATSKVIIVNTSKQLVPIHQKPPKGVDFYFGAEDVHLRPNQRHTFDKSRLWDSQVDRLQKSRKIQVIYDSDKHGKQP